MDGELPRRRFVGVMEPDTLLWMPLKQATGSLLPWAA